MPAPPAPDLSRFESVVASLHHGDFTALDPLFAEPPTAASSRLAGWLAEGRFAGDPVAVDEALACACFNGRAAWVTQLLARGARLRHSDKTGLNGLHWAANRGQLEVVRLLLAQAPELEARNAYGGTVLGATVWAAVHEPRPAHREIIAALLAAGADVREAGYPSGLPDVDRLLLEYGAAA